jgi:hypothetical protein
MGSCMRGMIAYNALEKITHNAITIKKPVNNPRLKTMLFLKPKTFALFMDMILLGPGVSVIMVMYARKEIHGNTRAPPL